MHTTARWTARGVISVLVAVLPILLIIGVTTGSASAATNQAAGTVVSARGVGHTQVPKQASFARTSVITVPSPPPTLEQQQRQVNSKKARDKVAVGGAALVLLVVVYFGRRVRNKHRRRLKNLQNAQI